MNFDSGPIFFAVFIPVEVNGTAFPSREKAWAGNQLSHNLFYQAFPS
jgi:hypothetical protein